MAARIHNAMLIDDEEIDQKQYTRILKRSGIVEKITTFSYADEAFEFLKTNVDLTVDVIFLDINMPRMTGFEFLEKVSAELKHEFAYVVIVMLTTSLDPKDRERASKFDVVRDFINKPLEIAHVEHAAKLLEDIRS